MSLRLRLFLLVAGLAVVLVAGEALLVRSLASRLDSDLRVVATRVGEQILSGFVFEGDESSAPPGTKKIVFVTSEAAPAARARTADPGARAAASPDRTGTPRWVVRHEWRRQGPAPGEVESHVDVQVVTRRPEAPDGNRDKPFVLEPRADSDVLLLRGPDAGREIRIPRSPVAATLDRLRSQLALGSLGILALGLLAAALLAHRVTRPLARLERAAVRLGSGELGVAVPVERGDEVGEVGAALRAFNAMSGRLAVLDRENRRLADNERLSELGEVARGLAHTLRNPLNALGLSIEELAAGPDAGRAATLAETSRRQIRRVDAALRSFLALASADAAEAEPVDLAALAREVALEALQDAGGRLRVEVAVAAPVVIDAVPAEVKAMLQALVVNACEASPAGARVVVRAEAEPGGAARLEVDDEGPGVPPEILARLGAPHLTTKANGSGMGLFLAQRLASGRYGGKVELAARGPDRSEHPEEGSGTRATLRLGPRREPAGAGP